MKNIDKIRAINAEELAKWKIRSTCNSGCVYNLTCDGVCNGNRCLEGLTKWLEQESNLMPEIKIGDLLTFASVSSEYTGIVIDNDTVFLHAEEERHVLKLLIKQCVNIRRYDCWKDEWKTIWRADDGQRKSR